MDASYPTPRRETAETYSPFASPDKPQHTFSIDDLSPNSLIPLTKIIFYGGKNVVSTPTAWPADHSPFWKPELAPSV